MLTSLFSILLFALFTYFNAHIMATNTMGDELNDWTEIQTGDNNTMPNSPWEDRHTRTAQLEQEIATLRTENTQLKLQNDKQQIEIAEYQHLLLDQLVHMDIFAAKTLDPGFWCTMERYLSLANAIHVKLKEDPFMKDLEHKIVEFRRNELWETFDEVEHLRIRRGLPKVDRQRSMARPGYVPEHQKYMADWGMHDEGEWDMWKN
ncbi:hypothetical protein K469DRAFT_348372 [Zopfia rhizophila CBS 207.26]|uniref:Uncharacterized protein n=1 Tax=Zopfia rhizophila CBS 207.26 TaxID=1314779 RepID=A0A6A6DI29_9PEZI|nr:hypothetical protein K469DRAFT_348372 [Zopfia rhizophila CBS 207.26]